MRGAAALAPLLATLLLAGCSEPAPQTATSTSSASEASLALPAWSVRDHWTFDINGNRATYVVTSETATHWMMETDSAERSFDDARDDISRLGPQRKADLAGSQGADTVEYLRFPLVAGASWQARWDGQPLAIKVLAVDGATARLEARAADGTLVYTYTYDARAGWFSDLERHAPDGSVAVRVKLVGNGHGWSGNVVRWTLAQGPARTGPAPAHDLVPFDVPAGVTDLWVTYRFACGTPGAHAFNLAPAEGPGRGTQGTCDNATFEGPFVEAPVAGEWGLTAIAGGSGGAVEYDVLLRTRTDVRVG